MKTLGALLATFILANLTGASAPLDNVPAVWEETTMTVSDQTHGKFSEQIRAAVSEYNSQQDSFDYLYSTEPCREGDVTCWTVTETHEEDFYAGRATFVQNENRVLSCDIELNSYYGATTHVVMHEMFHCLGYKDMQGTDEDFLHSDDPFSIISVVNNDLTELTDDDIAYMRSILI